jgi:hypothetical protein
MDRGEATRLVRQAREISGIAFAIYLGDLPDGTASARAQHAQLPDPDATVLVAVDEGRRSIDIVTGRYAQSRIDDRACELAILSMVSCFQASDMTAGVRDGVLLLAEHARAPQVLHLDEPS